MGTLKYRARARTHVDTHACNTHEHVFAKRVYIATRAASSISLPAAHSFPYLSRSVYELILLDFYDITYPHLGSSSKFIGL